MKTGTAESAWGKRTVRKLCWVQKFRSLRKADRRRKDPLFAAPRELQLKCQNSGITVTNWDPNPTESKTQLLSLAGLGLSCQTPPKTPQELRIADRNCVKRCGKSDRRPGGEIRTPGILGKRAVYVGDTGHLKMGGRKKGKEGRSPPEAGREGLPEHMAEWARITREPGWWAGVWIKIGAVGGPPRGWTWDSAGTVWSGAE